MHAIAVERGWKRAIPFSVLAAIWLVGNAASLIWLWNLVLQTSHLNLLLLGVALVALGVWGYRQQHWRKPWPDLSLRFLPMTLMLGSSLLSIGLNFWLGMPQLTVLCFLGGTYGLMGLVLPPSLWRQGMPMALLIACLLPFNSQFGSGLGFPARVLTAQAVEQLLAHWQIAAMSSHDIILLENGIAHIDLPCSGLRSLWTGTLFLFAATWLDQRQLGIRWLVLCLLHWFLLISANMARVLVLVLVGEVWQQPPIANVIHIPLGLFGFILACTVTWFLLRWVPRQVKTPLPALVPPALPLRPYFLPFLITLSLLGLLNAGVPIRPTNLAIAPLQWPTQLVTEPVPLTPPERALFDQHAALLAEKRRFRAPGLSGSVLVVGGTDWGTYHAPELCFVGNGLRVNQMTEARLPPNIQARWLSLEQGQLTATYWFQSAHQTTDDFLSRLWNQVVHHDRVWVMISVLFDRPSTPDDTSVTALTSQIHHMIHDSLTGGPA